MKFYRLFIVVFMFSCESHEISCLDSYVCEKNTDQYNRLIIGFVNDQTYLQKVENYVKKGFKNYSTVFTGSSTIANWVALEQTFAEFNAVNRGLAGSNIGHIILHSENLIFKNTPELLVLYVGDNDFYHFDIESFIRYMNCFVDNFFYRLPNSKLVLISVKPSPERMYAWDYYLNINDYLTQLSNNNGKINYIDIWTPIMSSINYRDYFLNDEYLHLNAKGYQLITDSLVHVLRLLQLQIPE